MAVGSVVVLNDFCHVQGGASRVAIDEAVALKSAGLNVTFLGAVGPIAPELSAADIRTILSATATTARCRPASENIATGVVEPPCLPGNQFAVGNAGPTTDHRSPAWLHQGADDHASACGAPRRLRRHLHAARLLRRLPQRGLLRLPAATALPSPRAVGSLHADQLRQAAPGPQGLPHGARSDAASRGALSRRGARLHLAVGAIRAVAAPLPAGRPR